MKFIIKINIAFFAFFLLFTTVTAQTLTIGGAAVSGLTTTYVGGASNQPVLGFSVSNTSGASVSLDRILFTHNCINLDENFTSGSYSFGTSTAAYGTFTAIPSSIGIGTTTITCIFTSPYTIPAGSTRYFYFRATVKSTFNSGYPTKVIFNLQSSTAYFRNTSFIDVTTNVYGSIANIVTPNLARTEATAYYWTLIPSASSTNNGTAAANTGINDGLTADLTPPADASTSGDYQAAGVIWNTTKATIGTVRYYNGRHLGAAILNNTTSNGYFRANVKLQSTTNGTTWVDETSWTCSPAYSYTFAASSQVYTFSGPALINKLGVRVLGQVRTTETNSRALSVTEIEVFPVSLYFFKTAQTVVETLANWSENADGTGNSPTSFTEPTQYYFTSNQTLNAAITSSASTKFILGNGGTGLTLTMGASGSISNATLDIPLASSGNNTLDISSATSPILGDLPQGTLGSIVIYGGGTQTVGGYTYNNLQINSNGTKTLGGNATVNGYLSMTIGSPFLAIGSNTLTLNGTVSNLSDKKRNLIANGLSNLVIGGTGAFGTLYFDDTTIGVSRGTGAANDLTIISQGTTNRLNNFTMNRGGGGTVTLGGEVQVTNAFTPTAGTLVSNGNLVMLSTETTTSSILAYPSSGFSITGDVVVQKFFKGGTVASNRGFRMISNPMVEVASPSNYFKILQNRFIMTGNGGVTNGFDAGSTRAPNAPTINSYVESGAIGVTSFQSLPSISTATVPGKGYYFFFRGNRSNLSTSVAGKLVETFSAPENWTATYIGAINTGDVSIAVTKTVVDAMDGVNLLGNPYPGTLDFQAFREDATNVGVIDDYVSIMNRNRTGFVTQSGKVINGVIQGTLGTGSTDAGLGIIRYIQPGQGFFVRKTATSSGSVTFKESHKADATNSSNAVRLLTVKGEVTASVERRKLIRMSIEEGSNRDYSTVVLEPGNIASYGGNDAPYLSNSSVACYTLTSDDKPTCINFMPSVEEVDSLKIFVTSGNSLTSATLNFSDLSGAGYKDVQLEDNHLGVVTKLTLDSNSYSFVMDKTKLTSFGKDRFVLRFVKPAIHLSSFSAQVGGNGVDLKWETLSELSSAKNFEIERSVDGTNFEVIEIKAAVGNSESLNKYSKTDLVPPIGTVYYRLKLNSTDGTYKYSGVETINFGFGNSVTIEVYPNPAVDELNVRWKKANRVDMVIYDMSGRVVRNIGNKYGKYSKIDVSNLKKGTYVLSLKGDNGDKGSNKFTKL